jgi:SAM-dependent methyltransferase
MKILDVGCGKYKVDYPGHEVIGMDKFKLDGVDVQHDILEPMPFDDNTFDWILCRHVLEHVPTENFFDVIDELYRILRPRGKLTITVPHASSVAAAFGHPDHKKYFVCASFKFLSGGTGSYYYKSQFKLTKLRLNYTIIDKIAFLNKIFNPLINLHTGIYEKFFSGILPADEILAEYTTQV